MEKTEYQLILEALKKVLKSKKISYENLAELSGISISTLKKSFAGQDMSMHRLMKICECIQMPFFDLLDLVKDSQKEIIFEFSDEQEIFFADHPIYFLFFNKLYREKNSFKEAQIILNISLTKAYEIINKLAEFKLLTLKEDESISFHIKGGIKFKEEGALSKMLLEQSSYGLVDYLLNVPEEQWHPFVRLNYSYMTEATAKELTEALQQVHQEFAKRSIRERRIFSNDKLTPISWFIGVGRCNALDFVGKSKINVENTLPGSKII